MGALDKMVSVKPFLWVSPLWLGLVKESILSKETSASPARFDQGIRNYSQRNRLVERKSDRSCSLDRVSLLRKNSGYSKVAKPLRHRPSESDGGYSAQLGSTGPGMLRRKAF
jgi:hypothetical protein